MLGSYESETWWLPLFTLFSYFFCFVFYIQPSDAMVPVLLKPESCKISFSLRKASVHLFCCPRRRPCVTGMRCLDRHYRTAFSSRVLFQSTARGMEKTECTKRNKQEDKKAKESSSFDLAWVMVLLTVSRAFCVCVCVRWDIAV